MAANLKILEMQKELDDSLKELEGHYNFLSMSMEETRLDFLELLHMTKKLQVNNVAKKNIIQGLRQKISWTKEIRYKKKLHY